MTVLPVLLLVCGAVLAATVAGAPEPARCWPGERGTDPRLCPPDDPGYPRRWEFTSHIPDGVDRSRMHPREAALGSIGLSVDAAWQHTTGRDDVIIAVLDSGIRWHERDLARKIHLNRGELPVPAGSPTHDANGDGVFDITDYAGDPRVGDANGNGVPDAGDLIRVFSDCSDDDGNGYPDDIAGYDFFSRDERCGFAAADNDPTDDTDFGHGTGIAATAAAETNNGIGNAGVCPRCRILPVRVGDTFVVDANRFARGVVFATTAGASVVASALGSYNNTPAARFAVDFAYERGVPVIASAADEFSYHHNYPSVYNHALYVNAIRYNHASDPLQATTFWGVNPCTNFGARVWVTVPATSCSSGATSRLAGVAGLVQSAAGDAGVRLHTEEVYQLLRATADDLDNGEPDWGDVLYPAKPGFDQLYGYGRVHAQRAVVAVESGRIPPIADLHDPPWFALVSPASTPVRTVNGTVRVPRAARATYRLEYALGVEPAESDYRLVGRGVVVGERSGALGVLDFRRLPVPSGERPVDRASRDRYSVTLRLQVTDDRGSTAEARRSFFVLDDPDAMRHFPVELGASGEAGPVLVDLDADGRDEIVLPTADGRLRIVHWEEGGLRETRISLDPGPLPDPSGATPIRDQTELNRDFVIRRAAVGDLRGDGRLAIVLASHEGRVYAFDARGERLGGFPVTVLPALARPVSAQQVLAQGILSAPVLADLDGRPGLEIVVTALDGHVYAWHGNGAPLAGFPVRAEAAPGRRAKIVSTPVVGDLDGDGQPEIVFGSNGVRDELSYAFAVRAQGNLHPDGPLLGGWSPYELTALRPRLLPTVATGVHMDPVLVDADRDGDLEVVLYAVTGDRILLVDHAADGPRVLERYSLAPGSDSVFRDTTFLAGTGSPTVADTDGDGTPELYAPLLPFRMLTLRSKPGVPLDAPPALGGWPIGGGAGDPTTVPMLSDYPRRMEDLMLFTRPHVADVDGDGCFEVLMGSGGYLLHAFRAGGGEAVGFPKFTGGWIFSEPATGDLDGDGRAELVTVTREGYLFAWRL